LQTEAANLPELSLLGGPLHRLGLRLRLVRGKASLPLGLVLGWGSWAVLCGLVVFEGAGEKLFSLETIAAHLRLAVVIPLLFLVESLLDPRLGDFVRGLARSGVVSAAELGRLGEEVAATLRRKDSVAPELLCLVAAGLTTLLAPHLALSGATASPEAARTFAEAPAAAAWYWGFCLPLFRFLIFRWLWRLFLWQRFLWRLSRLDLRLLSTHPDGAGGLGYVEVVQTRLAPLVLTISLVVSASCAEEIALGDSVFEVIYPQLALTFLVEMALILLPPAVFFFKLRRCQEDGLRDYGAFAAQYAQAFQSKWMNGDAAPPEPLLGTADVQSLADLSNGYAVVRGMRWIPVSSRLAIRAAGLALAPMLPLFLFKYPIAELAQRLFAKFAGL